MQEPSKPVHEQPEDYKTGWVHGFYDAKPDDGAFYGKQGGIGNLSSGDFNAIERMRLYCKGYNAGQAARLCRKCQPFLSDSVDELLPLNSG